MPATKVKVEIKAKKPGILAVNFTTYKAVVVGTGMDRRIKYRKFDSKTISSGTAELRHPGRGGLIGLIGIDEWTQVAFTSLRRLKKS